MVFGVDLGTTSVSLSVEDCGRELFSRSEKSPAAPIGECFERLVSPDASVDVAEELLRDAERRFGRPRAIGVTGQMHGILYTDARGKAVSPLYDWRDGRGNLPDGDCTFAGRLSRETGQALYSGYGCVTHAWNERHGCVPRDAAHIATLSAYCVMRLTGRQAPALHPSDAASLGMFDVSGGAFLPDAPLEMLHVAETECFLGETADGCPVAVSIGDNQASVLGALDDPCRGLLINLGTGGQVSAPVSHPSGKVETRPFIGGRFLLCASALSSGGAYAALERFFRECARAGGGGGDFFGVMREYLDGEDADPVAFDTRFLGTREDPGVRASISNLSEANFTPAALTRAAARGIAAELFDLYCSMEGEIGRGREFVCAGNAARKNPALVRIVERVFGRQVHLASAREEAAFGCAKFAAGLL